MTALFVLEHRPVGYKGEDQLIRYGGLTCGLVEKTDLWVLKQHIPQHVAQGVGFIAATTVRLLVSGTQQRFSFRQMPFIIAGNKVRYRYLLICL